MALLALLVNAFCPPGFMVAPKGASPTIVICTGHGAVSLPDRAGSADHRAGRAAHPGVCPFAGHGLTSAPPRLAAGPLPAFVHAGDIDSAAPDLSPGRGLAAPPPPSHAPPVLI